MLNFHDFNLQMLVDFFALYPLSAAIFTYLIVFIESMAVIGVVIPGVITMPLIGFLIGSDVIPAGSTFLWAIIGAITGDCLSYVIGIRFQERIHRIWPFIRWPNLLGHSERFFANHGGKSVFIGRFVGPMRAMIPMVAGMLKMPFARFLFAALPSAIFWAVGYMIPGVLLGALSLELPAKVATEFTFWALLVVVGLWLLIWLSQHFFRRIWQLVDYYIRQIWRFCQQHRGLSLITRSLSDPKEPDNHQQLTLLIVAVFSFAVFLFTLSQVVTAGILVDFSRTVYYLVSSLRSQNVEYIFVALTLLGDLPTLFIGSGIVLFWLLWQRYYYVAIHWLSIGVLSVMVISSMKLVIYSPRPGGILYDTYTSSFPSAHVALSLQLYGFLAVVMARELKGRKKSLVYTILGILVTLISCSRIYLGAHWLADVLGSILLGLVMLLIVTISYRRRHLTHFNLRGFALVVSVAFVLAWLGYSLVAFNYQLKEYTLVWPEPVVTFNSLTKQLTSNKIPLYRLNRLGKPIEAFNVVYVGNLESLSQTLAKNAWEPQPTTFNFQNMIRSFSPAPVTYHLPIFPQLYHNQRVILLFAKATNKKGVTLILKLWPSEIMIKDSGLSVWIGSISHHRPTPRFSWRSFEQPPLFVGATDLLASYLDRDFHLWQKSYSLLKQPAEMSSLHWDGKVLVVKDKL